MKRSEGTGIERGTEKKIITTNGQVHHMYRRRVPRELHVYNIII